MEKEKTQISLTLAENESVIRTWCENCDDIQIRPMKLGKTGGTGALLIYVEVAVSCDYTCWGQRTKTWKASTPAASGF